MIKNIDIESAREMLLERAKLTKSEMVPVEQSLHRVISSPIYSKINVPDFNRSPLDGYCLRSKDTSEIGEGGKWFEVVGKIGAGDVFRGECPENTAVRIMTGAPIPKGCDCVIMQEQVETSEGKVRIPRPLLANENLVELGEDIKSGELVLKAGKKITPEAMGVIASLGLSQVEVYRKPRVGITSTGNELMEISEKLEYGKIYNSNYYTLYGLIQELGGEVINLGISDDSVEAISEKVVESIDSLDMLITTGGASVGDYDLIHKVYENLGADFLFWRVKMKPGTPMLSSVYKDKLLIGLSGNPGAAMISFEEIVSPVVKKMSGQRCYERIRIKAELKDDFKKKSVQRRLLRAKFRIEGDRNAVYIGEKQNPGALKSMLDCNCFIDIEAGTAGLKSGDIVDIILLKGDSFL
ncbi:molybdopterin molybdenumtransferase [Andreesenia angusta]|uniref:Molybdopterin molybdenumtransferase n=1 Tax=Andreesenia angusta TaxID=39480 RepID=A0A1S1V8C5_9FIRM|nr:gephyrin-like molybdotransferase Glp [Andreesenia angusta]OHW62655.1 molybdopterin molybdenumtransferase [Andreesenia angusta]